MYRACSTWQYEVVAHLIEGARHGRRLGYLTSEEYTRLVRADVENPPAATGQHRLWRVLKSHEGHRSFARAVEQGRALPVYAYRDVRDVVYSLMHKRGMTFAQLLRQGMIHQVLANDRFWMAQPDVLVQRYEDLLADPAGGVTELARHLGIILADGEAARIARDYSLEANRARADALRRQLQEAGVDLNSATSAQICDPRTLLHWNHMRQGGAGSWRSSATPSERAMIERLCGRWLQARGYPLEPDAPARTIPSVRDWTRGEADLWIGRATFLSRAFSTRHPAIPRTIKRMFGLPVEAPVGATAWADAPPSPAPAGHVRIDPAIETPPPPGDRRGTRPLGGRTTVRDGATH
jgi:hypothetical protein